MYYVAYYTWDKSHFLTGTEINKYRDGKQQVSGRCDGKVTFRCNSMR